MQQGGGGGGREFHRVASELRVRITDGTYPPHSFLPSQRDLAEEFRVSRDTVSRVIRELGNEGWIESRQGSGSRVIKTQWTPSSTPTTPRQWKGATLGPVLSAAFEQPEVLLDVYTLTSESLDAHIRLQAERIFHGSIAPRRIGLRMILPAEELVLPYPRARDDSDDDRLRDRLHAITKRHTESLLGVLGLVRSRTPVDVDVEIRWAPLTPAFKLYLVNGSEALLGPYEVIERDISVSSEGAGEEIAALDVLGLGATLTHHVRDEDANSAGSVFVATWQDWFDSVWRLLAGQPVRLR